MPIRKEKLDKADFLRASIGYLIAWAVVAYYLINEFKENDGIKHIFKAMNEGNYMPVVLIIMSVILLALFIKNISFYFKQKISNENNHT